MANESKKCAHELCTCVVPDGQKYCSTFCEDSKGTTSLQCDCGHGGCNAQRL